MDGKEKLRGNMEKQRTYICIDLKSFYASVECVERKLNAMTTNLVVADPERTDKTICLAVSPSMKALGVRNRCRVFEIPENIDYIIAPPRMQLYIDYSANIYEIYLKYVSKEDIHVYSIDEAFLDVTDYLGMYKMTARELGIRITEDIFKTTGITASCGIGSNLYLAKIAMDITAKHKEDHIGILDEETYRKTLWKHRPITDFWRIGPGISRRLEKLGIYTMEDVAHTEEAALYKLLGVDAELLIDHAWGRESTTIADIKAFKPKHNCLSSGQVLACEYGYEKGKLIVKEMADLLCLELVDKHLATESISMSIGYANRMGHEPSRGSITIHIQTSSAKIILPYVERLYDRIVDRNAPIKRFGLSFNRVVDEAYQQYDLFTDPVELEKERNLQRAMIEMKRKFGKNAVLKGMNLEEGGTTVERNTQIGGHKSGD